MAFLLAGICLAGIGSGQLILRSPHFRDAIGILCGRGHLVAVARGEGIYEADLQRALAEFRYVTGVGEEDRQGEDITETVTRAATLQGDERPALRRLTSDLVENEKRRAALQNLAGNLSRRAEFVTSRF